MFSFDFKKQGKVRFTDKGWKFKEIDLNKDWQKNIGLFFKIFDLLAPLGFSHESIDGMIAINSNMYPLLPKYYNMLYEKAEKRKMYVFDYVVSCDFRLFNKRYSKTVDDTMRLILDMDKAAVMELHNFMISNGAIPTPRPDARNSALYEYKERYLMRITVDSSLDLHFSVQLGANQSDEVFKFMVEEITTLPNSKEMFSYFVKNMRYCHYCSFKLSNTCGIYCNKIEWLKDEPFGSMEEFFANERYVKLGIGLVIRKNAVRCDYDSEGEYKMLKQILDLHIKAIDSLTP